MSSYERASPHERAPYSGAPRPPAVEDTLKTGKLQIERKTFILTLKENPRGRFLRITEEVNGRRDTIIIPATGLEEFSKAVTEMTVASAGIPAKQS